MQLDTLARRLSLTRPLVFCDTETTGTLPEYDRVIELAATKVYPDGRVTQFTQRFDPQRPIPAEATETHGITDDDVRDEPTFKDWAERLAAAFERCDVAGFGTRFDVRMLAAEFARAGITRDVFAGARVIDACAIYHAHFRRDLSAAVREYLGEEHAHAHAAGADVLASVRVLVAQLQRHDDLAPTVEALAAASSRRDPSWVDAEGKVVWRDGAARLTFGAHAGKPLQDVDAGFFKWALGKAFAEDAKAIFRAALAGRYPTGPGTGGA